MAPHFARVVVAALLLPLAGCLLVISTGPTPLNQSTVFVIVRTEGSGDPVSGARVTVRSLSASLVSGGVTDSAGRFAVAMAPTDQELRAVVEVPTGFSAATAKAGTLDVAIPSGSDEVIVWLRRDR
jgi:hypothetical protein